MPRKSKSSKSKKRKSSKKSNESPIKDVEVAEANSSASLIKDLEVAETDTTSKQCLDESASSIQTENCDLEATNDELCSKIDVVMDDSVLEIYKSPSPPKDFRRYSPNLYHEKWKSVEALDETKRDEIPTRSESAIPTVNPHWNDWSIRTELFFARERSKSAEIPETPKLLPEPPLRKISSLPFLKSELTEGAKEIIYTQLILKRRLYLSHLGDVSSDLADYMEYVETVKNTDDDRNTDEDQIFVANSRWKQRDSADWFDLQNLWNKVANDLRAFVVFIDGMYEDFDDNGKLSLSSYEFQGFFLQLEDLYDSIALLLKRCINCCPKYHRFCASVKESDFLKNVSDFRPNLKCLQKKINGELNTIRVLKSLMRYA